MMHDYLGTFVTLEGPDGCGKTTQMDVLEKELVSRGYSVHRSREPGGSPAGEKIRDIILNTHMDKMTELLLFAAARAEHVKTVIIPALEDGQVVLCDRYVMSTYAYQGWGRGLKNVLHVVEQLAHNHFHPDHTLFFHVDFETSLARLAARVGKQDRIDQETRDFHEKVFLGYQEALQSKLVPNIDLIDASGTIDEVSERVRKWVTRVFVDSVDRKRSILIGATKAAECWDRNQTRVLEQLARRLGDELTDAQGES